MVRTPIDTRWETAPTAARAHRGFAVAGVPATGGVFRDRCGTLLPLRARPARESSP